MTVASAVYPPPPSSHGAATRFRPSPILTLFLLLVAIFSLRATLTPLLLRHPSLPTPVRRSPTASASMPAASGYGAATNPQLLLHVDALDERNWSAVATKYVPLSRVHADATLHAKVWLLAFDELWQLGLSAPTSSSWSTASSSASDRACARLRGRMRVPRVPRPAAEAHVAAGDSVTTTAQRLGDSVARGARATSLIPIGRPFVLAKRTAFGADANAGSAWASASATGGVDREVVHVYAVVFQTAFSARRFDVVTRPVPVVRAVAHAVTRHRQLLLLRNRTDMGGGGGGGAVGRYAAATEEEAEETRRCLMHDDGHEDDAHARWLAAAVAAALRVFVSRGYVPRSNPVGDARFDEPVCCKAPRAGVDELDLRGCGLACDRTDVTNILAHFPQAR